MFAKATENLGLPQWQPKDHPDFLTDMNKAFRDIDSAYGETTHSLDEITESFTEITETNNNQSELLGQHTEIIENLQNTVDDQNNDINDLKEAVNDITEEISNLPAPQKQAALYDCTPSDFNYPVKSVQVSTTSGLRHAAIRFNGRQTSQHIFAINGPGTTPTGGVEFVWGNAVESVYINNPGIIVFLLIQVDYKNSSGVSTISASILKVYSNKQDYIAATSDFEMTVVSV